MPSTLTKRSIDRLRKEGYLCQVVETFNRYAGVKNDLFGFLDILAVRPGEIMGVQVTSQGNMQSRITKIAGHKNYIPVKESGMRIVVHGWKKGKDGRKIVWLCGEVEL